MGSWGFSTGWQRVVPDRSVLRGRHSQPLPLTLLNLVVSDGMRTGTYPGA